MSGERKEANKCIVCGKNLDNSIFKVKEMMIGTREEFDYVECPHCKSLQILNNPEDISKYYSHDYYSTENVSKIFHFTLHHISRSYLKMDILGKFFRIFHKGNPALYGFISYLLANKSIDYDSQILDVGCGIGIFLKVLSELGFKNLNGMEPFIEKEINNENYTVFKDFLDEFNPGKKYDLIFMNDSLEHMEDPYTSLSNVKRLLKDDGYLIISIPVKSEFFWNLYGTSWFEIDAPRHFVLFTLDGFEKLLYSLNLEIEKTWFNSTSLAFIISEDYSNNISMYDPKSFVSKNHFKNVLNEKRIFKKVNFNGKKVNIKFLNNLIDELNEKQASEHAVFLIKRRKI